MLQNSPMFAENNHENELWFCDMEKLVGHSYFPYTCGNTLLGKHRYRVHPR